MDTANESADDLLLAEEIITDTVAELALVDTRPAPALRTEPKPPAQPAQPELAPPAPQRSFAVRALAFLWSVKATLVVLAVCGAAHAVWVGGAARDAMLAHATFTESHWTAGQYHVLLTHGFLNERGGELAIWLAGLLLFGVIVETNIGSARTLLLATFCSATDVLGYALFNTPDGYEWALIKANQLYWWVFEKWGFEKAQLVADAWRAIVPLMAWSTPLVGSAAVCSGFITFAVCRRTFEDGIGFRRWNLLLAVVFLAVALGVCWGRVVGTPIPYVLLFGGALGGLAYIFPDKAINQFVEWLREQKAK